MYANFHGKFNRSLRKLTPSIGRRHFIGPPQLHLLKLNLQNKRLEKQNEAASALHFSIDHSFIDKASSGLIQNKV